MNTETRKAELEREITKIGDFYAREYHLAVEPLQRELMDLEALSLPFVPPVAYGINWFRWPH